MESVRAAVLVADATFAVREFPRPVIGPQDALLGVEANGLCGTDVHWFDQAHATPRIMGHEVVGRILDIGDEAAARWGVHVGDRVAVESGLSCGSCRSCLAGHGQRCAGGLSYGSNISTDIPPSLWGGLAEAMYLSPQSNLTRLDEHVPADVAAGWFSPLANAVDWLGPIGGNVQPGDVVTILGPGPQGLAACVAAKARGASQIILAGLSTDRHRLQAGLTLGADHIITVDDHSVEDHPVEDLVRTVSDGRMSDVVLDVSGSSESARTAVTLLAQRGTIAAPTPLNPGEISMPMSELVWKQARWIGLISNRPATAHAAARLLTANITPLSALVTHRFRLEHADTAINVTAGRVPGEQPIKVVICPQM